MFVPSTWYLISKELANVWGELEEEVNVIQTESLVKGYDKGTKEWYKQQLRQIPGFRNAIVDIAKKQLLKINDESIKAIQTAIDLADKEVTKALIQASDNDSDQPMDNDKVLARVVKSIYDYNTNQIDVLLSQSIVRNNTMINNVNVINQNQRSKSLKEQTQSLYDTIKKQTEIGIEKGVPITYSNGRQMPFKAHMEMSVRTFIQNEMLEQMLNASDAMSVIFFLCSEKATSAPDHAPYQGKIYVHENWESIISNKIHGEELNVLRTRIQSFISAKDIKTIQWVKGSPVYMSTRPNCGHFFVAISIDQAMGDLDRLKRELKTKKGTYKEDNYKDLLQQRHNERRVRYFKGRARNDEILLQNTKDPLLKNKLTSSIQDNRMKVREWQATQRALIQKNSHLMRNYNREDAGKMAQDLGVSVELQDVDIIKTEVLVGNEIVEKEAKCSKKELKAITQNKFNIASSAEPSLTKDIMDITKKAGATTGGIQDRLKEYKSINRKIRSDYIEAKIVGKDLTLQEVADNIKDANRYTAILEPDNFVEQYESIHSNLLDKGYKIVKTKNTFKDADATYRGVNSNYMDSNGVVFELQFHTKESFELKNGILHTLYSEWRDVYTPIDRKKILDEEMIKLSNTLKIPKNINKI